MKQVYFITSGLYNFVERDFSIGGIQTYLQDLYKLVEETGSKSLLIDLGHSDKKIIKCKGFEVLLYPFTNRFFQSRNQSTFDDIYKEFNSPDSVFIIDTDQRDISSNEQNVIQIQHGIAFDIPGYMIKGIWGMNSSLQHINKLLRCIKNTYRLYHTKNTVCVDYNYYNWFRTLGTIKKDCRIKVIPNYTSSFISRGELAQKLGNTSREIQIIFARRFVDYRGTLLMVKAVEELLKKYPCINVTFAGEGPLKGEIKHRFANEKRVLITSFSPKESVSFHKGYDVAVVPTIFSEGTSLSLCESMAAGCVPIATHVGGMTNIILNGYNGFLIAPSFDELLSKLCDVLSMKIEERNRIAINAYESVISSFSQQRWKEQWTEFLKII